MSYKSAVRNIVQYLWDHEWCFTARCLGALLVEPWYSLKAAFFFPFKNSYVNPSSITPDQVHKNPILLIHGNYHNSTAWMYLAKKIKSANLGPVYTVDLPNGYITDLDYAIINKKIAEIKSQYKQHGVENIKIDIVGHSRGGSLAYYVAWTAMRFIQNRFLAGKNYWHSFDDIGKVIKVGSVFYELELLYLDKVDPLFRERAYEITAQHDVQVGDPSLLSPSHQVKINTGHLGLLFSDEAHDYIIHWLK